MQLKFVASFVFATKIAKIKIKLLHINYANRYRFTLFVGRRCQKI